MTLNLPNLPDGFAWDLNGLEFYPMPEGLGSKLAQSSADLSQDIATMLSGIDGDFLRAALSHSIGSADFAVAPTLQLYAARVLWKVKHGVDHPFFAIFRKIKSNVIAPLTELFLNELEHKPNFWFMGSSPFGLIQVDHVDRIPFALHFDSKSNVSDMFFWKSSSLLPTRVLIPNDFVPEVQSSGSVPVVVVDDSSARTLTPDARGQILRVAASFALPADRFSVLSGHALHQRQSMHGLNPQHVDWVNTVRLDLPSSFRARLREKLG